MVIPQAATGAVLEPCRIGNLDLLSLQPGEWLDGYCGRLARINGLKPNLREVTRQLHKAVAPNSSEPAALIPALSRAAGLDSLTLVLDRTTWPAILATNRPSGPEIRHRLSDPNFRKVFSRPARREEWFCPDCASDDFKSRRFSVWRREHQLPGSFRCSVHARALVAMDRGTAVGAMPSELGGRKPLPISRVAQNLVDDPFAQRASAISNAVSSGTLNLEVEDVAGLLLMQAATRLSVAEDEVTSEQVKALLTRQVNPDWVTLALQYGSSQARNRFAYVDRLLFGNFGATSGAAVAITAAALFDSANAAIQALMPLSQPFDL